MSKQRLTLPKMYIVFKTKKILCVVQIEDRSRNIFSATINFRHTASASI